MNVDLSHIEQGVESACEDEQPRESSPSLHKIEDTSGTSYRIEYVSSIISMSFQLLTPCIRENTEDMKWMPRVLLSECSGSSLQFRRSEPFMLYIGFFLVG